jgi:hypothetical protein
MMTMAMTMILIIKLFVVKRFSVSSKKIHLMYFLVDLNTDHETFYICKFLLFKHVFVMVLI